MFVHLIGYVLHENIFPANLNVEKRQKNHRSTAVLIHYQT